VDNSLIRIRLPKWSGN